jgi:hypothetical protein
VICAEKEFVNNGPEVTRYWPTALRYYAKVSLTQSAIVWAPGLAVSLLYACWTGITAKSLEASFRVLWAGASVAGPVGAAFFAFAFVIALGDDFRRNWGTRDRVLAWNPLLVWKVFLYCGCLMFSAFAWFSYRQDHSIGLGTFFLAFAIGSAVVARKCL